MISDINIYELDKDMTVDEFLFQYTFENKFTANDFIKLKLLRGIVKDSTGKSINVTNEQRILAQYTAKEKEESGSKTPGQLTIKKGTQVGLVNAVIKRKTSNKIPDVFQLTDFLPFISEKLNQLLKDPTYHSETRDMAGEIASRIDNSDITVYVWIRSITDVNNTTQEGTWYNISAFIDTLQTTVSKSGGGFNIVLSPVIGRFDEKFGWHLSDLRGYEYGDMREDIVSTAYISKYKNKTDNFKAREDFFFNTVLQENDLVYIRFERLASEREQSLRTKAFSETDVPNNIYDMIGLIDNVSISNVPNASTTVVQGRDLMKVLIEDGSYFFPELLLPEMFPNKESVLFKRNMLEIVGGKLKDNYPVIATSFKTIDTILKYIFNKFSNIGVVSNSALRGYGDRAIKEKYNLTSSSLVKVGTEIQDALTKEFLKEDRQGVWRIIDMVFDPSASRRVMADNSISTDQGSIINSVRKLCQEPLIEFYGDTYGDKYNFVIRKPPFDEKGYKGLVYDNVVTEELLNAGIGQSDRIRQNQIDKRLTDRANNGRPNSISNLVIDIDENDVLSENFEYSHEAYSWYRIVPKGLGITKDITKLMLNPVIALEEYAKVFGNKAYHLEYNYTPIELVDDVHLKDGAGYIDQQTFLDMQFIVSSHVYLPFTRQGVIRIIGDRTIKRGMFIYYKPTDEVFYVDAVNNVRTTVTRETILQVSRGMKEKYIKGVNVNFPSGIKKVSYFNIVPTPVPDNATLQNTSFLAQWREDLDVFNFFLQRRQWVDNNIE